MCPCWKRGEDEGYGPRQRRRIARADVTTNYLLLFIQQASLSTFHQKKKERKNRSYDLHFRDMSCPCSFLDVASNLLQVKCWRISPNHLAIFADEELHKVPL